MLAMHLGMYVGLCDSVYLCRHCNIVLYSVSCENLEGQTIFNAACPSFVSFLDTENIT